MINNKEKQKIFGAFSTHFPLCLCLMKEANIKETSSKAIAFFSEFVFLFF